MGEIKLGAIADARRTERRLPAIDSRSLHVHREEDARVIQGIMVEKVGGASEKVVGVQDPVLKGKGDTDMVFFIALACQRQEINLLSLDGAQSRAGKRAERWGMIKVHVKDAVHTD